MIKKIINKRKQAGFTQNQIADILDINIRTYQRFESGETELKASQFIQLMYILPFTPGERIDFLLDHATLLMKKTTSKLKED